MKKPRPKLFHQNFCVTAPSAELFQLLFFSSSDRNIQLRKFKAKQGWREEKQNRENQFCVCFWLLQKVLMSIEKKRSKRKSFKWSSPLASISHRFFALFWVCEWIWSDRGLLLGVLDVSSIAICLHILLIDAGTQRMFSLLCNQSAWDRSVSRTVQSRLNDFSFRPAVDIKFQFSLPLCQYKFIAVSIPDDC